MCFVQFSIQLKTYDNEEPTETSILKKKICFFAANRLFENKKLTNSIKHHPCQSSLSVTLFYQFILLFKC